MAGVLQVNRLRAMKGTSEKGDNRPSSGSSSSSKSSQRKEKEKKDTGPTKDELIEANTELSAEVEELSTENQVLKATISSVIDKLIENAKIKGVKIPQVLDQPNVAEIPADVLVNFAEKLTAESRKNDTMEFRVEELETRITHLNFELAKLLRSRVNMENGLDELINDCTSFDEVQKKARDLWRDIRKC